MSETGKLACISCAAGTYNAAAAQTTCIGCAAGKSNALTQQTAATVCIDCVIGKYTSTTAQTACISCEIGRHQATAASTSCTNCVAGKTTASAGQDAAADCTDCAAGQYNVAVTASPNPQPCIACEVGKYTDQKAQTACITSVLPAGGCIACPIGKSRDDTTMTCVACARGTYQNEVGQKGTCKDSQCCKGTYASAVANGATHEKDGCLKCAAGKYQSETGKAQACIDCAAGQFSDLVGASACKTGYCALGKYMTATGQSDPSTMCIACAVGTYKDSTVASYSAAGTTSCKNARCNSGFSIAATGQTTGDVACAACGTATGDIGTVNTHAIGGTDQCKACLKVQVDGGTATAATATAIAVTESTQVNSAPNTIEVRFRVTGRIYPGTQVEISGFNDHSETTDNTALPISGASAATYGSTGDWKQNTGKLTLTVATIANVAKDSVAEQNALACAAATTEAACTAVGTNLRNYGTGAPYNTAANQVYKGAKCQWTGGTTTCSPVSGYADAQLFPWGWYPPYLRADVTFDVTITGVNLAELDTPQKVTDFKAGQQAVYATRFEVALDRVRIALRSGSIIVEATIDAPAAQVAAVQATLGNATARAELMAATVQQATTDLQTATGQTFVLTATAPAEAVVVPTEVNPNSNPLGDLQTALVGAGVTGDDPVNNPITVTGAAKPKPTHGSGEWTAPLPVEETGELAPVPPSDPTPTPTPLPANPFPPGAIVGIVLGGVFVLAAGLLFVRRLQKRQEREKGGAGATTAKNKNKPELELVGV
eukprot:g3242.t1